ncbi:hypothetical protein Q8A73_015807 [Channa argus]|nr:hypothetical protein Q8A73_015807 [Channa argus]
MMLIPNNHKATSTIAHLEDRVTQIPRGTAQLSSTLSLPLSAAVHSDRGLKMSCRGLCSSFCTVSRSSVFTACSSSWSFPILRFEPLYSRSILRHSGASAQPQHAEGASAEGTSSLPPPPVVPAWMRSPLKLWRGATGWRRDRAYWAALDSSNITLASPAVPNNDQPNIRRSRILADKRDVKRLHWLTRRRCVETTERLERWCARRPSLRRCYRSRALRRKHSSVVLLLQPSLRVRSGSGFGNDFSAWGAVRVLRRGGGHVRAHARSTAAPARTAK